MISIYHITHFANLAAIIADGGLFCDRRAQEIQCLRIGHKHIKERRLNRQVPLVPGGCVGDYVPFYFAPRSPMLYAIHKGYVEGYSGGQSEVVHLVSSVEVVNEASLAWVFTDGHAEMAPLTEFFDDLKDLDKVDWNLMNARYWHDTDDDMDRKRRRQAEFLVRDFFPWELITEICVADKAAAGRVEEILENSKHKPRLGIRPGWYY